MASKPACLVLALTAWAVPAFAQIPQSNDPNAPSDASKRPTVTTDTGKPIGDDRNSTTAGPEGPTLLQDFYLLEKIARFDRERIPERVVHARGVGVHGEFVVTDDVTDVTRASFLAKKGKKTPVFARFSTVVLSKGSADTARDVRGFAVKFYTDEGNYDLVGNDIPVFFIRDAIRFPDLVHSLKPSPTTNVQEPNRYLDFFAAAPETTHMMTFLFSDQGTPASFREMDGFGVNTFKWVDDKGEVSYVKYRWKSAQGVKNLSGDQAKMVGGLEPAFCTKDMYDAVTAGKFPSWDLQVQVVPADKLRSTFDFDPLDATKDWPESIVKFRPVGKMTLNKMPDNFFQETEQVAFNTGAYVPGIEASEDKLLQGRNFSYSDTQRHRLGTNYQQLPVNRPTTEVRNVNQEGLADHSHTKGDINYEPSIREPKAPAQRPEYKAIPTPTDGVATQESIKDSQDFRQAGDRIRAMTQEQRDHMKANFLDDFKKVKDKPILERFLSNLYQADKDFTTDLAKDAGVEIEKVKQLASAD
jgi:catalase